MLVETHPTVACYGEACVDYVATGVRKLPSWGKSSPISGLARYPGGNAGNCTIALAKLGRTNVVPILKLGQDPHGQYLRECMVESGIPADVLDWSLIIDPVMHTPVVIVLVQESKKADRAFLHANPYPEKAYGGLGMPTVAEMVSRINRMPSVRFHHFAGIGNFDAITRPEVDRLIRSIRSREGGDNSVITADTVPVEGLREPHLRASLRHFLQHVDFFVPSDLEAALLTDNEKVEDFETSAERVKEKFGPRNVVVKIHELGAYLLDEDGHSTVVEPFPLRHPLDSTGAGDAWCAGFLSGLADGRNVVDACTVGNAVAHYCIQAVGATSNIPAFAGIADIVRRNTSGLRLFVSHADKRLAQQCAIGLRDAGARVTWDADNVRSGELTPQIASLIKNSDAVVVIASESAIKSQWVQWELEEAGRQNIPIYMLCPHPIPQSLIGQSVLWSGLRREKKWQDISEMFRVTEMRPFVASIAKDLYLKVKDAYS